jgi:hypothetical protein
MTTRITIKHEALDAANAVQVTSEGGDVQRIEPGQSAELFVSAPLKLEEVPVSGDTTQPSPEQFSLAAIGAGVSEDDPTEHPVAPVTAHNITRYGDIAEGVVVGDDPLATPNQMPDQTEPKPE